MFEWLFLNLRYLNSKLRGHGQVIYIDYPVTSRPRHDFGSKQLTTLIEKDRAVYAEKLQEFQAFFEQIKEFKNPQTSPNFKDSIYYPNADALALYSMIRLYQPKRYFEVGSGSSTHFARKAVTDAKLSTAICCVDPFPRREIADVADKLIYQRLEDVDLSLFDQLEANDIFFFDGSHRCFTNSDVTVAFLDIIPRLKPGVIVHIHDIFLPDDYPADWNDRYYSEQYLLACYLLAETQRFQTLLPMRFILNDPALSQMLAPLELDLNGGSFWLKIGR
ncbi:MAG TPA: class I SAM-dependent methyltransferase [Phototrophicaceae bacterium]|nr:class I SAM-dependent methyltransferase [Phototrophicaceae bacterium]